MDSDKLDKGCNSLLSHEKPDHIRGSNANPNDN